MRGKQTWGVLGVLGWLLIASGVGLLVVALGPWALGAYQTATYRQPGVRAPWRPAPAVLAPPAASILPLPGPDAVAATVADVEGNATAEVEQRAPQPQERTAVAGPPRRLRIPSIGVDSVVIELGVTDKGEWELPNEEVGWYRHTALPGTAGNAVLIGHLNNAWGLPRVFARLKDVRVGDVIEVETDAGPAAGAGTRLLRYLVAETRVVPNTAVEVMDPTDDARLTLFTCAGSWNVGTRDYTHRQLVVARPV